MKFNMPCSFKLAFAFIPKDVHEILWFLHDECQVICVHSHVFPNIKFLVLAHPNVWFIFAWFKTHVNEVIIELAVKTFATAAQPAKCLAWQPCAKRKGDVG